MPSTPLRSSSAAVLLLAFVAASPGQSLSDPDTVSEPLTSVRAGSPTVPANRPDFRNPPKAYTLGPGDLLSIHVLEAESSFGDPLRISTSGAIHAPMAGSVPAGGLTVAELETSLTERLKTYVHDPHITVNVIEYRSRPVTVIGAVENPGVQILSGDPTLLEVLSQAGGCGLKRAPPSESRATWPGGRCSTPGPIRRARTALLKSTCATCSLGAAGPRTCASARKTWCRCPAPK